MSIPHEQIRDEGDRSWSLRLVAQLSATFDDDELDEIVRTLQALDDYRTVPQLITLLEDRRVDERHRTEIRKGVNW